MDNNNFLLFLESITDKSNKLQIDTIKSAYLVVLEAFYPDDSPVISNHVDYKKSAVDRFNDMAAQEAENLGNNTLHFLKSSHDSIKNKYAVDNDSELDNIPTSDFSSEIGVKHIPKAKDTDFGFNFTDV